MYAQDGVDTGLVAALLPESAQQVGIQPHRHNFFRRRHNDCGIFPEIFIRAICVGVGRDALSDAGSTHAPQLAAVRATFGSRLLDSCHETTVSARERAFSLA